MTPLSLSDHPLTGAIFAGVAKDFDLQIGYIDGMLRKLEKLLLLTQPKETGRITILWVACKGAPELKEPFPYRWKKTSGGIWHSQKLSLASLSKQAAKTPMFQANLALTVQILNQVQTLIERRATLLEIAYAYRKHNKQLFRALQKNAIADNGIEAHILSTSIKLLEVNENFEADLKDLGINIDDGTIQSPNELHTYKA